MRLLLIMLFVGVSATSALGQAPERMVPPEFQSDGCTGFPDGNYFDCCLEHDKDYFFGGSLKERRASDKRLKQCVQAKNPGFGGKLLAGSMWIGVRIGGMSFLPTPFRWGFGNKWPRMKSESAAASPNKTTGQ